MATNTEHDGHGNYTDCGGVTYQTPDAAPPWAGTPVTKVGGDPTQTGVWIGGYVHPDKKD